MKKLHTLVTSAYLIQLVMTFFIALFVLLMQFVWKYVDDLVGKGLEWYIIAQLLFFASASFVPMALPLAILLSSIMTFGNFGEHSELTACKASGISLQRIMAPLIVLSFGLSVFAFYFSNYILPVANLKFGALLYDVREQRPAFALKEGVFYTGLEGYSIRVNDIGTDGQTLRDIMVYDHSDNLGNIKLITADSGMMHMSVDNVMTFTLYDGSMFDEMVQEKKSNMTQPYRRSDFKECIKRFDMSAYKFKRSDEDLFRDNYAMLNLEQLNQVIDTVKHEIVNLENSFKRQMAAHYSIKADTLVFEKPFPKESGFLTHSNFIDNFQLVHRERILEDAATEARSMREFVYSRAEDNSYRKQSLRKYFIELHRKFTLSIACLILFFIGAPLGAIIRKGGLGMPVFMATVFFVIYHLISITGEKSAKEDVIDVATGMWMASAVMFPMGLFLTIKATTDSALFDLTVYTGFVRRIFGRAK